MADVRDRVAAEMENVGRTLKGMPAASQCAKLSTLELAGVAALLHNFYNGIENILKQVLQSRGVEMPTGDSWHRDLVALAAEKGIITAETLNALRPFLAFRHFFSHAYALDLQAPRMESLVENVRDTYASFSRDVTSHLDS